MYIGFKEEEFFQAEEQVQNNIEVNLEKEW